MTMRAPSGAVTQLGKDAAGRWATQCCGPAEAPHLEPHREVWPSLEVALFALYAPWEWCEAPEGCPPEPLKHCPLCDHPQRTSEEYRQRGEAVADDAWRLVSVSPRPAQPDCPPDHSITA